jgi:hypothetical protein
MLQIKPPLLAALKELLILKKKMEHTKYHLKKIFSSKT